MTREVLMWEILGQDLVGTRHACALQRSRSRTGVLLLNAGPAPRAGNSDLSVHIADRLAEREVPVFRFDFAGLGDSSGATPRDKEEYWREVLAGRNDAATLGLVRRVKREFDLSHLIVGGLCAAALPALRAADRDAHDVAGVILLEPVFHLTVPRVKSAAEPGAVAPMIKPSRLERSLSLREWLLFLTGENRLAQALRPVQRPLLAALKRTGGHALANDANLPLVDNWRNSLARGVASLVVVAQGQRSDSEIPRILRTFPAEHAALVSLVRVPHTNHVLTGGSARAVVAGAVESWVCQNFAAPAAREPAHAGKA